MGRLDRSDVQLLKELMSPANSYEDRNHYSNGFDNSADEAPISTPQGGSSISLKKSKYNPNFQAQFNITWAIRYFTVAGGVYTSIAAAALVGALKTKLPGFLFGHSDKAGGFANLRSTFALQGGWVYETPFCPGVDVEQTSFGVVDATGKAAYSLGDLVFPFTAVTAGPVNTVAFVVVHCQEVAYGSLLEALGSDRFKINMIRYKMPDVTLIAQFAQNIAICRQTLFGKFNKDNVNASAYQNPEQMQTNIIDVAIEDGIDKNKALQTVFLYTSIDAIWSIYVETVDKLQA